jgi:hypothetical protein
MHCAYAGTKELWCDSTAHSYQGGRKCVKGFCDWKESNFEAVEYEAHTIDDLD